MTLYTDNESNQNGITFLNTPNKWDCFTHLPKDHTKKGTPECPKCIAVS